MAYSDRANLDIRLNSFSHREDTKGGKIDRFRTIISEGVKTVASIRRSTENAIGSHGASCHGSTRMLERRLL